MEIIEKISKVINTLNSTKNLSASEYNKDKSVLEIFTMLYNRDELNEILKSKDDLDYNKFDYLSSVLRHVTSQEYIELSILLKEYLKIEDFHERNGELFFLIKLAIERDDICFAEKIIESLSERVDLQTKYLGHRIILKYYANLGNHKSFIERLKKSEPSRFPRNDISEYKSLLVESYTKKYGLDQGLELCKDKLFGSKFAPSTIFWNASNLTLDEIMELNLKYPIFKLAKPFFEAEMIVHHFWDQRITQINDEEFEFALNEVLKIDKNIKDGSVRERDNLLYSLGISTLSKVQIDKCKKNIVAPFFKKELNYHLKNIKDDKYA